MASKKQYSLSEEDVKLLRDLERLDHHRHSGFVVPTSGIINPASQVFIANVSSTIPARSGSTPGTASCSIFEARWKSSAGTSQDVELVSISSLTENVYNLSTTAVSSGYYVVRKEKFGHWVIGRFPCSVPGSATASSTSTVVPAGCCPDGYPVVGYSVVVSGMSGTSCLFNIDVDPDVCTINCADLNGTYSLTRVADCLWTASAAIAFTNCGTQNIVVSLLIQEVSPTLRDIYLNISTENLNPGALFFYALNQNVSTACADLSSESFTSGVECCGGGSALVTAVN